jgi:hypothetical protein
MSGWSGVDYAREERIDASKDGKSFFLSALESFRGLVRDALGGSRPRWVRFEGSQPESARMSSRTGAVTLKGELYEAIEELLVREPTDCP